jgi:hypothetical protein
MSQVSRRPVRSALGFDALEERHLLSHFSVPMSAAWGRSGGDGDAPRAPFAMVSNHPPGPFGGTSSAWAQAQEFSRSGAQPGSTVRIPAEESGAPASSASSVQQADPPAPQPTALASVPARPGETFIGSTSGRPTKAAASEEGAINVAPAGGPSATTPSTPEVGGDQIGAVLSGGTLGLAQSVSVFLSLTSAAVVFAPPWAFPSGPSRPAPPVAPRPDTVSGDIATLGESAGCAPANLPAPRGAGLITSLAAFRHGQFEEFLTRILGGLTETSKHQGHKYPNLVLIALAVSALEAVRRWRRRSTRGPRPTPRFGHFVIDGRR